VGAAVAVGILAASCGSVGFGAAASTAAFSSSVGGGGAGVSSTAECLPVVQGGILRNSSKVRTRGLQHFQPVQHPTMNQSQCPQLSRFAVGEKPRQEIHTFLSFVKHRRSRVIYTASLTLFILLFPFVK
jgi:hypothetical protein